MSDQIKYYRVKLDGLTQLIKELKPLESGTEDYPFPMNSYEVENAYWCLMMSKAWLGIILEDHGGEITEDKKDLWGNFFGGKLWSERNHVEKIEYIKEEINSNFKDIKVLIHSKPSQWTYVVSLEQRIMESIMWLDLELKRYKEEYVVGVDPYDNK